jgi:YegS/Rv2252/BmrU family lipid kinase
VTRRLALLVNPAASGGAARQKADEAAEALRAAGAEFRVVVTTSADDAREQAKIAADAGETAVAVGGDGLIGTLAGALAEAGGALALIPAGRGNDFARMLGLPTEPHAAARVAATGEERLVDVAYANGRPFVGIASVGFDSDANRIANEARLVRGNLVYLYAALRALAAWRDANFDVVIDGQRHPLYGLDVVTANSQYHGGGMHAAPMAEVDDGQLDVVMCAAHPKLHTLRLLAMVFKGTHVNDPLVTSLRGERVDLSADRPFTVYADGDPIADLPVEIRVRRRALRVVVPAA